MTSLKWKTSMQPNAEMSSGQTAFDLKAAREALSRATERPNVTTDIYHLAALTYLPAALDEIERLQAALALKTEQHKGQAYVIGSYLGMLTDFNELNESQAKRSGNGVRRWWKNELSDYPSWMTFQHLESQANTGRNQNT